MRKFIVLSVDYAVLLTLFLASLPILVPIWIGAGAWRWYRRMELRAFYDNDEELRRKAEWKAEL